MTFLLNRAKKTQKFAVSQSKNIHFGILVYNKQFDFL